MKHPITVAIIGCGLTGTSFFYQLVQKIKPHPDGGPLPDLALHIFEKSRFPGPGLPYAKQNIFPFHLCNMPAGDMSIDAQNPDDFIQWLSENRNRLVHADPRLAAYLSGIDRHPPESLCLPRMVMGQYLADRFEQSLEKAAHVGIPVTVETGVEVTDIREHDSGVTLVAGPRQTAAVMKIDADFALLSTGHWSERSGHARYFSSPWPAARLLDKIPPKTSTAILGTGLSAIDTALTLFSDGRFATGGSGGMVFIPAENTRTAVMYSRNGLLPKVRGQKGRYRNVWLCQSRLNERFDHKKTGLCLEDLFALFKKEIDLAYGPDNPLKPGFTTDEDPVQRLKTDIAVAKKGDTPEGDVRWQTILAQAVPLLKSMFLHLAPEQRARFHRKYKSVFMTYAAAIPIITAERILALLTSGCLSVCRLTTDYTLTPGACGSPFEFSWTGRAGKRVARHDFIVDATGQKLSWRTNPSQLARNMLASGMIRLQEEKNGGQGGLVTDPVTHRISTFQGEKGYAFSRRLFAVGIMNQGQIINASMAFECAVSAGRVVEQILSGPADG